jgi:hypothetical protein
MCILSFPTCTLGLMGVGRDSFAGTTGAIECIGQRKNAAQRAYLRASPTAEMPPDGKSKNGILQFGGQGVYLDRDSFKHTRSSNLPYPAGNLDADMARRPVDIPAVRFLAGVMAHEQILFDATTVLAVFPPGQKQRKLAASRITDSNPRACGIRCTDARNTDHPFSGARPPSCF